MTRRNITKETQKAIDEAIIDLLAGRYEGAKETFKNVIDDLKPRTETSSHADRFRPYFWTASFGYGLAEGTIEKSEPEEVRDISTVAKEANNFYNVFISIAGCLNENRHEVYQSLGKSYVSLGFEREGIAMLEQLRRPRLLDFAKISVKAKELLSDKQYKKS